MMKSIIALMLFMSHTVLAETHVDVKPNPQFSQDAQVFADKVESQHLKFVPEEISFPEGKQKEKFELALSLIEDVMNSPEFKKRVIGFERNGERSYRKNYLWQDSDKLLTNEEIYQVIMNGNEKMRADTPGEMNFNSWVKACKSYEMIGVWCRKVIGSTSPSNSKWIRLNWTFYKKLETHEMVSNMVHEWLHLLGFLHGKNDIHEEVPYVVGYIAGEVAREMIEKNKLE